MDFICIYDGSAAPTAAAASAEGREHGPLGIKQPPTYELAKYFPK